LHHNRRQIRKKGVEFATPWIVPQIHQRDGTLTIQGLAADRTWSEASRHQQTTAQKRAVAIVQQEDGRWRSRQHHGAAPPEFRYQVVGQTILELTALLPWQVSPISGRGHHSLPQSRHNHEPHGKEAGQHGSPLQRGIQLAGGELIHHREAKAEQAQGQHDPSGQRKRHGLADDPEKNSKPDQESMIVTCAADWSMEAFLMCLP
jgi:hypothetical protein